MQQAQALQHLPSEAGLTAKGCGVTGSVFMAAKILTASIIATYSDFEHSDFKHSDFEHQ